jgi:thymidine phosphorylase
VFTVDGTDPQFELDLLRALGAAPYEVTVECAYAILLVAPPAPDRQAAELARRNLARSKAVKRFVRQVENRSGVQVGQPLRTAYRRLKSRIGR